MKFKKNTLGGVNYNSISVAKTFIAGSTQGQTVCVTIQTIDDMVVTSSLIFYVNLYSNTSGVIIGDRVQGASLLQVTINNINGRLYIVFILTIRVMGWNACYIRSNK